jgi:hypothetical protein
MQEFFALFATVDPLGILVTLVAGIIWAFIFREWQIDKRTVVLAIAFYAPLLVGRLLYVLTEGTVVGSGYIGFLFFIIYFLGAIIGRKFFHGKVWDNIERRRQD